MRIGDTYQLDPFHSEDTNIVYRGGRYTEVYVENLWDIDLMKDMYDNGFTRPDTHSVRARRDQSPIMCLTDALERMIPAINQSNTERGRPITLPLEAQTEPEPEEAAPIEAFA